MATRHICNSSSSTTGPRTNHTKNGKLSLNIVESNKQNQRIFCFRETFESKYDLVRSNICSQICGWIVDLVCDRPLCWLRITTSVMQRNRINRTNWISLDLINNVNSLDSHRFIVHMCWQVFGNMWCRQTSVYSAPLVKPLKTPLIFL